MVNSASQALAEFKNQQLGSLLGGGGSTVNPGPVGANMMDSVQTRMARLAPKSSSTAFLSDIRRAGQNTHAYLMQNIENKKAAVASSRGYALPDKPAVGGKSASSSDKRGQYGLTVPAAQAFNAMSNSYSRRWGNGLSVTSGGRTHEEQAQLYADYKAGRGNLAAPPGSSMHEFGIAVDLGGPISNGNSAQHAWLRQNAATFGWYWVGQRYGEPWHWEYHPDWK